MTERHGGAAPGWLKAVQSLGLWGASRTNHRAQTVLVRTDAADRSAGDAPPPSEINLVALYGSGDAFAKEFHAHFSAEATRLRAPGGASYNRHRRSDAGLHNRTRPVWQCADSAGADLRQ